MAEAPTYVILGRGRWAQRMHRVIAGENRAVAMIEETRQRPSEKEPAYVVRLADAIRASAAQIAWLCVFPGPHVTLMIHAALEAGLHVVVEKPWYGSAEDTHRLQAVAQGKRRLLAVHFEYLVLEEVKDWRKKFHPGASLCFGGHFLLGRSDPTGIPAIDNLGCHLLAIREFAVPASEISEIQCAYERPDERLVWLERGSQRISSIDLFQGSQHIIQNFIREVEAALGGATFPFDLEFGLRVAKQLNACKGRRSA